MGYATKDDLVERFGETELIQLTDREQTGAIDDAVLDAKLADADAEIDAYLVSRYSLPLAEVPLVLRRVAADIARYHLYDDHATEGVQQRYKDAIKFLESLAAGKVQLGLGDSGAPPPSTSDLPKFYTTNQVFGANRIKDYTG